jgi:hypothetical protein
MRNSELKVLLRAIRKRNWKFARFLLRNMTWGLTHNYCHQCGHPKGFSMRRVCWSCAYNNVIRNIFQII